MPRLLRLPQVMDAMGLRATSVYARVKMELLTPPIKLTPRSSAWPESEIAAVNSALIAGKSDDQIRRLVKDLVAARFVPDRPGTLDAAESDKTSAVS